MRNTTTHITLVLLLAIPLSTACGAGELKIIHINIGQGDATLILGPMVNEARKSVLVDSGNITFMGMKDGGNIVRAVLLKNGVSSLDVFIATHYDADHIGGTVTGLPHVHGTSFVYGPNGVPGAMGDDDDNGEADFTDDPDGGQPIPQVGELGMDDDIAVKLFVDRGEVGSLPTSTALKKYFALVRAVPNRKSLTTQNDVDTYEIDLGGGATMVCLAANGMVRGRTAPVPDATSENERSLCFIVQHGDFDYLIGGDTIGKPLPSGAGPENAEVEGAIAEHITGRGISVDVLHVNHHGADNASATAFLEAIHPRVAVLSAGNKNTHGHPSYAALIRLAEAGVERIYQTELGNTKWHEIDGRIPSEVRRRQAVFQGDVTITSDGESFEVSTSRKYILTD